MMLIWKLLRQHISIVQLAGFFVANLVGMSIILCGVQIYNDLKPLVTGEGSVIANDYIVISKPVASSDTWNHAATRFTEAEIADLRNQPFVENVGEFRSARFDVCASMPMINGYTMLFFESVPDSFVDVKSDKWRFRPGDRMIPIIIPRTYLNLYNFGFSQSQGHLPQLSESALSDMPLVITIKDTYGRQHEYEAYIVGFSDRLNTILVPESFLSWANNIYGRPAEGGVSRLIFEVENPADGAIGEYLEQRGYRAEANAAADSKVGYLLKVAVAIIVGIGVIFSLLSLFILTLSIYLLLQKNTQKLENLTLAGYAPSLVAAPYQLLALLLNVAVMIGALIITLLLRGYYLDKLSLLFGAHISGTTTYTILIALLITTLVVLFNAVIIWRKVAEIARKK